LGEKKSSFGLQPRTKEDTLTDGDVIVEGRVWGGVVWERSGRGKKKGRQKGGKGLSVVVVAVETGDWRENW